MIDMQLNAHKSKKHISFIQDVFSVKRRFIILKQISFALLQKISNF